MIHSITIGVLLTIMWRLLARRGLFNWRSAGFWAWLAFGLYFTLNPLFSVLDGYTMKYEIRLSIAGGTQRALWILLVNIVGIVVFYVAYFRTKPKTFFWRLNSEDQNISPPMMLIMIIFILYAGYSLLIFRAGIYSIVRERIIENGIFIGDVSGYENSGYVFLFVPVILLILSSKRIPHLLGLLMGIAYIVLSLPDKWSRYATISMLLAIIIANTVRRSSSRPRLFFMGIVLLFAITLQLRGHIPWTLSLNGSELMALFSEIPNNLGGVLGSIDASMLSVWYLQSYVVDTITGYDFGIPIVNYLLTGWIPTMIFPQKYFMIDWLKSIQPDIDSSIIIDLYYGGKSTLFGSFYTSGGIFGVGVFSWLAGILSRKLDGMLAEDSPNLIKAIGISWMSVLWLGWASSARWNILIIGALFLPGLALWIVAPKITSVEIRLFQFDQNVHDLKLNKK